MPRGSPLIPRVVCHRSALPHLRPTRPPLISPINGARSVPGLISVPAGPSFLARGGAAVSGRRVGGRVARGERLLGGLLDHALPRRILDIDAAAALIHLAPGTPR